MGKRKKVFTLHQKFHAVANVCISAKMCLLEWILLLLKIPKHPEAEIFDLCYL